MIQREILLPVHGMEKFSKGLIGAQLLRQIKFNLI